MPGLGPLGDALWLFVGHGLFPILRHLRLLLFLELVELQATFSSLENTPRQLGLVPGESYRGRAGRKCESVLAEDSRIRIPGVIGMNQLIQHMILVS